MRRTRSETRRRVPVLHAPAYESFELSIVERGIAFIARFVAACQRDGRAQRGEGVVERVASGMQSIYERTNRPAQDELRVDVLGVRCCKGFE